MAERAEVLYERVAGICGEFIFIGQKDVVEETRELFPELEVFARDFFQENVYGFTASDYGILQSYLLGCFNDCIQGIEQRDRVLIQDVLDFGIREFLKMLLPAERQRQIEEGKDDDV